MKEINWNQECGVRSSQCTGEVAFIVAVKRPEALEHDKEIGNITMAETALCFPCFVLFAEVTANEYGRGFDDGARMVLEKFSDA